MKLNFVRFQNFKGRRKKILSLIGKTKLCTNFRKEKKMLTHKKGGQEEYGKSQTATGPKPPQIVECQFFFFRKFQRMTSIPDDSSLSSD